MQFIGNYRADQEAALKIQEDKEKKQKEAREAEALKKRQQQQKEKRFFLSESLDLSSARGGNLNLDKEIKKVKI